MEKQEIQKFPFFLQEDEIVPAIYGGLSEDDRFIGKLLAAQNFMVNIQNEVTKLVQDYMRIRQKDRKLRIKNEQKQIKRKTPANFPHHYPQQQQQPPSHYQQQPPPAKKSKMSHPQTPKTSKNVQHKPKGWPKPKPSANNKPPKTKTKPAAQPKTFVPTQPPQGELKYRKKCNLIW